LPDEASQELSDYSMKIESKEWDNKEELDL
jgi:hypothetical protein